MKTQLQVTKYDIEVIHYKPRLITLFCDYWNNYISVDTFAENNGYSRADAVKIVNAGRELYNENVKFKI